MRHGNVLDILDDEDACLDIRLYEQVGPLPGLKSGFRVSAPQDIMEEGTLHCR